MQRLVFVSLFLLFLVRFFFTDTTSFEGKRVRVTAKVFEEPTNFETSQLVKLKGYKIYLPRFPEVNYGDKLVVEGVVEEGSLKNPVLIKKRPAEGLLYRVREKILTVFEKNLPSPHAGFVAGLTLGSKKGINSRFWEDLKKTGTAHVVVASGMNVTLVAGFLIALLAGVFPRKIALGLSFLGVIVYTLLIGLEAPIVRASIMGAIAFLAVGLGRINSSLRALFFTGLVMLIVKPLWIKDVSFLLSFLATLSLILFEAKVDRLIAFVPGIFRESLATSLSAQVGVLPLMYFVFGNVSLISPLVNALTLWVVAPVSILGMLAGLVGIFSEFLAKPILFLAFPLVDYFVSVIDLFS